MAVYKTPDVFVEEISTLPPSVAEVSTAIPAFIGYTAIALSSPVPVPVRITSFLEYITIFGGPAPVQFMAAIKGNEVETVSLADKDPMQQHKLYYALDIYFKNGGSDCYIVSLGAYKEEKSAADFKAGIDALITEDEPTLIVLSEATTLPLAADYYDLCQQALDQCSKLQDRFCIFDVQQPANSFGGGIQNFRNSIGTKDLKYGAAYYPYLNTSLNYVYKDDNVTIQTNEITAGGIAVGSSVSGTDKQLQIELPLDNKEVGFTIGNSKLTIKALATSTAGDIVEAWKNFSDASKSVYTISLLDAGTIVSELAATKLTVKTKPLSDMKQTQTALYNLVKQELNKLRVVLPPSPAVAGIYAYTDKTRGVWKAPANVSLSSVIGPVIKIGSSEQENLNEDADTGKSINAIRSFTGKGTLVWGARTLAGNDNEWRYVPVRRLFIMIEESAKKASYFAVFEPNDAGTWLKVKGMIESFLYNLWQQGALAGSTSKAAYYVNVGLGTTMTAEDILRGRMIVEIGIAAVRPAEFIILRFSHKLQEV